MHKNLATAAFAVLVLCQPLCGEEPSTKPEAVTFEAMDLWIDSGGEPLAAYQVEITYDKSSVKIVGLEGGQTSAYTNAPYYDRDGFDSGRIVVAAFTTDEDAPKGRTRVARIHLAVAGKDEPDLAGKLMAAAKTGGKRITPEVELVSTPQEERDTNTEGE
jgi:hypothetical protein